MYYHLFRTSLIFILQRLKLWEARERKKGRENDKEKDREGDRKAEEVRRTFHHYPFRCLLTKHQSNRAYAHQTTVQSDVCSPNNSPIGRVLTKTTVQLDVCSPSNGLIKLMFQS